MLKKRVVAVLVAGVLAVSGSISAAAASGSGIYLSIDGLLQKPETDLAIIDGSTMISVADLAGMTGATLTWSEGSDTAKLLLNKRTVSVTAGSTTAVVNYVDWQLPTAAVLIDGQLMAPLKFICERFSYTVGWDAATRTVTLNSLAADYSVIGSRTDNMPPDKAVYLTYAQALDIIISNDSTLNNMDDNFVIIERQKDEIDKAVKAASLHLELGSKNIYTWEEIQLLQSQRQMDNQLLSLRATETLTKLQSEQKLRNILNTIATADLNLYLSYQQLDMSELELANMRVKLGLGMESQNNVTAKENSIAKTKLSLEKSEATQAENRRDLAEMLYYDADTYIVISDYDPSAGFTVPEDLEGYIDDMLENAPSLVSQKNSLDNYKYVYSTYKDLLQTELRYSDYVGVGSSDSSEVIEMQNNITTAQRSLESAQSSLESTIRASYASIVQLEQSYDSALLDLEDAITTYKTTITNYMTGYATWTDVQTAEMSILNAEAAIEQNRDSYESALYSLRYPFM